MSVATLDFSQPVAAPVDTLWSVWTAPAARAIWAAPDPSVTVEFLYSDPVEGGRERSLCKVAGQPDLLCDAGWLSLAPPETSVHYEYISQDGAPRYAALVTTRFSGTGDSSRIDATVQLSSLIGDRAAEFRQGYGAGLVNLAAVAERTMVIRRPIKAPRQAVMDAWLDPASLPQWWGPDGFTCRTKRIDIRTGGDWVFDMIAPDGTVFPNHHRYAEVGANRLSYTLLWGENGPRHADAWASFDEIAGITTVTLGMVMNTAKEYQDAKGFGAPALGLQTLGKLARFIGAD